MLPYWGRLPGNDVDCRSFYLPAFQNGNKILLRQTPNSTFWLAKSSGSFSEQQEKTWFNLIDHTHKTQFRGTVVTFSEIRFIWKCYYPRDIFLLRKTVHFCSNHFNSVTECDGYKNIDSFSHLRERNPNPFTNKTLLVASEMFLQLCQLIALLVSLRLSNMHRHIWRTR